MRTVGQILLRGILLFMIGTFFSFVLSLLQIQRHLPLIQYAMLAFEAFCKKWWLLIICGLGSALIGLVYPYFNGKSEDEHMRTQEWSRVLRCVAMFVGINEACVKIDFPSNLQLSLSLAIMSIGLWWYFDRTKIGLLMGISIATIATLITQMLVYHEVCVYSEKEFSYVRAWLPCVVFSGGITIGNIGKQLAANDFVEHQDKKHVE